MKGARQSPAEDTAALLVQAERSGSPVLIPGAFEKRAAGPAAPVRSGTDVVLTGHAHPIVGANVERLEHERQGGGAPSTRAGKRSGTLGARLWQSLLHPTHLPNIWRRVLPHAS
jgi:hypothetical protein